MQYIVECREIISNSIIVEADNEYNARKEAQYVIDSGGTDLNNGRFIDSFIVDCHPAYSHEEMRELAEESKRTEKYLKEDMGMSDKEILEELIEVRDKNLENYLNRTLL